MWRVLETAQKRNMELKEVIKKLNEGKIVVDGKDIDESRFFLFGFENVIYYIHDVEINEDKMKLAVKNNQIPCFLAENWWENKWKVYEETDKRISRIIHNAVKGISKPSKDDEEFFDNWYKKQFGELK